MTNIQQSQTWRRFWRARSLCYILRAGMESSREKRSRGVLAHHQMIPNVVKWGHAFCQNLLCLLPAPSNQVDGSTAWLLCCKRSCSVDICGVRPTSRKQLVWRFVWLIADLVFLQEFLLNILHFGMHWFFKAIVFAVSWAMGTSESCQHNSVMFADICGLPVLYWVLCIFECIGDSVCCD